MVLTGCATEPTSPSEMDPTPSRPITAYLQAQIDEELKWQEPGSLKYEILKDYYITDEEFHHAYDVLVECLAAKNITPGWDPSFQTQGFNPDRASQDWYARDAQNEYERIDAIQEAQREYDACDQQSTDTLIGMYIEQTKSSDGRPYFIRFRDALIACGFSEFINHNEEQMREFFISPESSEENQYTTCIEKFDTDENTF